MFCPDKLEQLGSGLQSNCRLQLRCGVLEGAQTAQFDAGI